MKIITTKTTDNEKSPTSLFRGNIDGVGFYVASILISVAIIILMILAFKNVWTKADEIDINREVTVVIDAGHGGEDGGAVANGAYEKDINLSVAQKLNELFVASGVNTVMTRTEDVSLSDEGISTVKGRKTSDLKNRLKILNESNNNILISIHQNKFTEEKYSGTQIFYSKNNSESSKLAESIKKSVVGSLQPDNTRETKPNDSSIYILNNTKNIAVLVECGFLSNKNECAKLQNNEYQKQLCMAIYQGFINYISG